MESNRKQEKKDNTSKYILWTVVGATAATAAYLLYKQCSSVTEIKTKNLKAKEATIGYLKTGALNSKGELVHGKESATLYRKVTDSRWRSLTTDGKTETLKNRLIFPAGKSGRIVATFIGRSKNVISTVVLSAHFEKDADGNENLIGEFEVIGRKVPMTITDAHDNFNKLDGVQPITILEHDGTEVEATDETELPLWDVRIAPITVDAIKYIDFQARGYDGKWVDPEVFEADGYSVATHEANDSILPTDDKTVSWTCNVAVHVNSLTA